MAIIPYELNGQTCYLIRYKAESRIRKGLKVQKQRKLGVVSPKEARLELNQLKREVKQELMEKERNQLSWKHLLTQWFEKDVMECHHPTSTKKDNYNGLLMHTKSLLNTPVDQITPLSVQMIFSDMSKQGLSRGRMKTVKGAMNVVFDWGVLNRVIPPSITSPARGAKLPKKESKTQPVLSRVEIKLLLKKAKELNHEYYPVWAVAFETGCRSGELWALKWDDVDFGRKFILISKSYNSRMKMIKSTKTGESRKVPISPGLEAFLKELKLKTAQTGYVLPRLISWRRGEAAAILREFCKLIGITEIPLHGTRACFAVHCLESGNDFATTMKLGGWHEVKSFQHYVRLAGVDIKGMTDGLKLIPETNEGARVLSIPTRLMPDIADSEDCEAVST